MIYSDEYDDPPVSSTKRGGGGAAFSGNGGSSGATGLYPCSICNRTFASDRIQKHEAACVKASKQRRVFDSTKQRLEGTEAVAYFRKGKGAKVRPEPQKYQVIDRIEWHRSPCLFLRFQNPIGDRNTKISSDPSVTLNRPRITRKQVCHSDRSWLHRLSFSSRPGGRLADLPPPPASLNPDYVPCPHCGRNYAPAVAQRHIPKCVNIQNKPKPPPGGFNRTAPQQRAGGGAGASSGRTPISNYGSASGGFNNSSAYPPPNRSTRGRLY